MLWTVWGQALSYDNVSAPRKKNTADDVKRTYHSSRMITAQDFG